MIRTTFEIWSADLETLDNGTVTICSRFFVLCKYQTTFCTFIHVKELKRNGLKKKEKSVFCFLDSYKILCCGHCYVLFWLMFVVPLMYLGVILSCMTQGQS